MNIVERFRNLRAGKVEKTDTTTDIIVDGKTLDKLNSGLSEALQAHGKTGKLLSFPTTKPSDIPPGLYCETDTSLEDWKTGDMTRSTYKLTITRVLEQNGVIDNQQITQIRPEYTDKNGRVLLGIKVK